MATLLICCLSSKSVQSSVVIPGQLVDPIVRTSQLSLNRFDHLRPLISNRPVNKHFIHLTYYLSFDKVLINMCRFIRKYVSEQWQCVCMCVQCGTQSDTFIDRLKQGQYWPDCPVITSDGLVGRVDRLSPQPPPLPIHRPLCEVHYVNNVLRSACMSCNVNAANEWLW